MGSPRLFGVPPYLFPSERMKGLEPSTFCMARTVRERTGDDAD
jgi:hypothetical protein